MTTPRSRLVPIAALAALGLVIAAAAWLLLGDRGARPAPPVTGIPETAPVVPAKPAATSAPVAVATPGGGPLGRTEIGTPTAAAPAMPAAFEKELSGITGRIVEADGSPSEGNTVELLGGILEVLQSDFTELLMDPDDFHLQIELQKVTTGKDGRFHFTRVDPRAFYLLGVNLGRGRPSVHLVDETPNPGERSDLGDLTLDPPLAVTGRIVDSGGRAVAGARVRASALPAPVFQSGAGNVGPGSTLVFRVEDDVKGKHVTWSVPRWFDQVFDKLPFPSTTTEPDGAFRIEGAPGGQLTLLVDGAGLPAAVHGPIPSTSQREKSLGDVVVSRGEELEGIVVDEDGNPVPRAEVRTGIPSPMSNRVGFLGKSFRADDAGRFVARGLVGHEAFAMARAPEAAGWGDPMLVPLDGDEHRIVVQGVHGVRVRVTDELGAPLGARLAVQSGFEETWKAPILFPPLTPKIAPVEAGVYRVAGLPKGEYIVHARSDGFAIGHGKVVIEGGAEPEVVIALRQEVAVRARVLGKVDGRVAPLEAATVIAAPKDGLDEAGMIGLASARTDAEGRAKVRALLPGTHLLVVTHPGHAMTRVPVEVPSTGEVEVRLLKGGTIEGVVHDGGRVPETPKTILLSMDEEGDEGPMQIPRFRISGLEGRFRFTHLAPGKYNVVVLPRLGTLSFDQMASDPMALFFGFRDLPSASVMVEDEAVAAVDLDLSAKRDAPTGNEGRLRGVVRRNGIPLANARLMAVGADWQQAKTDDAGAFDFGAMPPGDYSVMLLAKGGIQGGAQATRAVKLEAAGDEYLEFDFQTGGPISGTVHSRVSGRPASGAVVMAAQVKESKNQDALDMDFGFGEVGAHATTDGSGAFELADLPVGTYSLRIQSAGHAPGAAGPVTVTIGSTSVPLEIYLDASIQFAGRVEIEGSPKMSWAALQFSSIDPPGIEASWVNVDSTSGRFETDELAPGRYRVTLQGARDQTVSQDSSGIVTTTRVESIDMGSFEPIEFTVPRGGTKSARLVFVPSAAKPEIAPVPHEQPEATTTGVKVEVKVGGGK